MPKVLQIALLVLLPLVWGLGVERVFEYLRRRRGAPSARPKGQQ